MIRPSSRCPRALSLATAAPTVLLTLAVLALPALGTAAEPTAGTKAAAPTEVDLKMMMERAKQYTQPSEHHQLLKRFIGEWTTEMRFTMHGQTSAAERGSATGRWLIDGRWLVIQGSGTIMGMPSESFFLLGYDNFKMSYVGANVSSLDTALTTTEGDVDPATGSLISYGTLDEYLTGEHDKMVKSVWRFIDANTLRLEVHDLPIGETGTKVFEIEYRRKN